MDLEWEERVDVTYGRRVGGSPKTEKMRAHCPVQGTMGESVMHRTWPSFFRAMKKACLNWRKDKRMSL